jgi:hypothetical protein
MVKAPPHNGRLSQTFAGASHVMLNKAGKLLLQPGEPLLCD